MSGDAYSRIRNGIPTPRDRNDGIPDIVDAINRIQGSSFARNADADHLYVERDEVWKNLGGQVTLIGLSAGYTNTFGVYTDLGAGNVRAPIFKNRTGFGFTGNGTFANPYPSATIPVGKGAKFGWYLSANQKQFYFSDPSLNPAGMDHLMVYDLPQADGKKIMIRRNGKIVPYTLQDPYLLAWEDIDWNGTTLGDEDFDDMLFIVDRVQTIPEPSTLILLAGGLLALGVVRRRRIERPV